MGRNVWLVFKQLFKFYIFLFFVDFWMQCISWLDPGLLRSHKVAIRLLAEARKWSEGSIGQRPAPNLMQGAW